jgi:predicted TIM-barrel fold metal-dependent hydrolase
MTQSAAIADLQLVDPHHHLWDLERFSYPWLMSQPHYDGIAGDITTIAHSYLLDDYKADQGRWKVSRSVHVEAAYDPADPLGETRWLQATADTQGMPDGIVAAATLEDPDVERVLAGHRVYANVRGIRQNLNWHPNPAKTVLKRPDMMTDPAWLSGFGLLKKYDLSFDLQLYPSQMQDAARLAARYPDISIILNHAGMPLDRDEASLALWHGGMKALAAQPNVSAKISGLGMMDWHWSTESIRPFVLDTIEYFGVERSMFASNFPVDRLYSSFDALYDAFAEIVRDLTENERRALFGDTAARVYRLTCRRH